MLFACVVRLSKVYIHCKCVCGGGMCVHCCVHVCTCVL